MRLMQSGMPHDVNLIGKKGNLNYVMWLSITLFALDVKIYFLL